MSAKSKENVKEDLEALRERLRSHETWCEAVGTQKYLVEALRNIEKDRDELRALVIEIAQHYDPMFGHINLHRLDDQAWMSKAAKVVGEDEIFPWKKADDAVLAKLKK